MNYEIEAKIITPVHVGAGQEKKLKKYIDFFYPKETKKIILVDVSRFFLSLQENERSLFLNKLAAGKATDFYDYLRQRKFDPLKFKIAEIESPHEPNDEVLPLITTPSGNVRVPYIPGSSVKGAIRSVIITHLSEQERKNYDKTINEIALLGNIENNLMSFIHVSDFMFKESRIDRIKTFNLMQEHGEWLAGWKHERKKTSCDFEIEGFVIFCETFKIGSRSTGNVRLKKERLDYVAKYRNNLPHLSFFKKIHSLEDIFGIINEHTKRYLLAEKKFFEHYHDSEANTDLIISAIDNLIKQIPKNNSECLLHMGFGSGWHGITGNWKFADDHIHTGFKDGKPCYKSRKVVFRKVKEKGLTFYPMGFLKLSILSEA
ncbi:MAG TPA: type III-A CRISPR-associated RAMP protein Csm5 [Bacteroidales bacterium]|nr:type III-A CRISPR-associated RAMP protein Csm5 [Bacteroidales bacterium]